MSGILWDYLAISQKWQVSLEISVYSQDVRFIWRWNSEKRLISEQMYTECIRSSSYKLDVQGDEKWNNRNQRRVNKTLNPTALKFHAIYPLLTHSNSSKTRRRWSICERERCEIQDGEQCWHILLWFGLLLAWKQFWHLLSATVIGTMRIEQDSKLCVHF